MSSSSVLLPRKRVLTADISVGSFPDHVGMIMALGAEHRSSYVCCVNAHMMVEARAPSFAKVVAEADLATADGMPVLMAMRRFHHMEQERVAGNDLMPAVLAEAEKRGLSVYLHGGTEQGQQRILDRIAKELPRLKLAGHHVPPFATIEQMDFDSDAERINSTGANIVLVSLGCPKQERWMNRMKGKVNAVMLGMGGAFLLYAGIDTRAPEWMRKLSLEWLYRLVLEPRRLWKRYLVTNSLFMALFLKAFVSRNRTATPSIQT